MEGFKRISAYRAFLMGFAILWVLPVHLTFRFPGTLLGTGLAFVKTIGYGGVDIFLFLSGFGLFCSLERDARALPFWKRRLSRLLPAYLPAMLVWVVMHLLWNTITWPEILGNLFSVGWWFNLGKQLNWYTQAIFAFYLLAPPLYRAIVNPARPRLTAVLLFTAAFAASAPLLGRDQLLFTSRLPIFLLGMYAGRAFTKGYVLTKRMEWALYALMLAGVVSLGGVWYYSAESLLWTYGLWWFPFVVITPGLSLLLSAVADALSRTRAAFLVRALSAAGNASYEIYLLHFIELQLLDWFLPANTGTRLLLIVASVATGLLYRRAVEAARGAFLARRAA